MNTIITYEAFIIKKMIERFNNSKINAISSIAEEHCWEAHDAIYVLQDSESLLCNSILKVLDVVHDDNQLDEIHNNFEEQLLKIEESLPTEEEN